MGLLKSKALSGRQDPSSAYLALWARHFDSGVVEITNELEMAYDSGYTGTRAQRTWQERMRLLEKLGFIKCQEAGNPVDVIAIRLEECRPDVRQAWTLWVPLNATHLAHPGAAPGPGSPTTKPRPGADASVAPAALLHDARRRARTLAGQPVTRGGRVGTRAAAAARCFQPRGHFYRANRGDISNEL
jgi:hypothetical protein